MDFEDYKKETQGILFFDNDCPIIKREREAFLAGQRAGQRASLERAAEMADTLAIEHFDNASGTPQLESYGRYIAKQECAGHSLSRLADSLRKEIKS